MKLVIDTQNMKRHMDDMAAANAAKKLMAAEEKNLNAKLPDDIKVELTVRLAEKILHLYMGGKPGIISRLFFGARRVMTVEADLHPNFGDYYVELMATPGWHVDGTVISKWLPEYHTVGR